MLIFFSGSPSDHGRAGFFAAINVTSPHTVPHNIVSMRKILHDAAPMASTQAHVVVMLSNHSGES